MSKKSSNCSNCRIFLVELKAIMEFYEFQGLVNLFWGDLEWYPNRFSSV